MKMNADVTIAGGGVIGLTAALYLHQIGRSVIVLERGDCGQESSWAGAGILPPPPQRPKTALEHLAVLSDQLHEELHARLKTEVAIDNGFWRCGGYDLVEPAAAAAHVKQWKKAGLSFTELAGDDLKRFEPALDPGTARVYYFPTKAQLRNPRHVKGLLALLARQITLYPHCLAEMWEMSGARVTGVRTPLGLVSSEQYLIASGAWSDSLLLRFGWRPGIHPVRGQIALLQQPLPGFTRIIEEGKRYLVPRPDGRVLVGSTEENVGFVKKNTVGAIAELLAFAVKLVPGLRAAPLERCWAGLRPGSRDGLPIIGKVPGVDNVFVAAGHYRSGIQYSTGTGLALAQLMSGVKTAVSLKDFQLDRL